MKFRVNNKAATKTYYLAAGFNTLMWGSSVSTVSAGVADAKSRVWVEKVVLSRGRPREFQKGTWQLLQ